MAATDFVTEAQIDAFSGAIEAHTKGIKILVNNNATDLAALTTTNKANLVAAVNELDAAIDALSGGGAQINDATTTTTTTWSSTKINGDITAAVAAVVASSPAALDTLDELAAALGDDPNFAATTATALGNRVRYDAAQSLTGPQQVQARANIAAVSSADVTASIAATSVRFDAAQSLTAPQQLQARTNIAVITSAFDFAAAYTAGVA